MAATGRGVRRADPAVHEQGAPRGEGPHELDQSERAVRPRGPAIRRRAARSGRRARRSSPSSRALRDQARAPRLLQLAVASSCSRSAIPGVPDFYQGTELWDDSLVDPDNRRPVDFALRQRAARGAAPRRRGRSRRRCVDRLRASLERRPDQAVRDPARARVPARPPRAVRARRLRASCGDRRRTRDRVVAFAREHAGERVVIAVGRHFTAIAEPPRAPIGARWGDTALALGRAGSATRSPAGRSRRPGARRARARSRCATCSPTCRSRCWRSWRDGRSRARRASRRRRRAFRVWAPRARDGRGRARAAAATPLVASDARHVRGHRAQASPPATTTGSSSTVRSARPDPVSRWQPHGVHGAVARRRSRARSLDATTRGAGSPLDELRHLRAPRRHVHARPARSPRRSRGCATSSTLGVTAIELMPVAEFPGGRNWGYDGVHLFAPQSTYGGPDGLRTLVDACHARRARRRRSTSSTTTSGPRATTSATSRPYFTDRYRTPWGDAINVDGPGSDGVRRHLVDQRALLARRVPRRRAPPRRDPRHLRLLAAAHPRGASTTRVRAPRPRELGRRALRDRRERPQRRPRAAARRERRRLRPRRAVERRLPPRRARRC